MVQIALRLKYYNKIDKIKNSNKKSHTIKSRVLEKCQKKKFWKNVLMKCIDEMSW